MLLLSFYVDDLLTGEDNEKDAVELINVTNDIMKDASMELRKWSTNCPTILETCNVSEENTCRDEQSIKIFGMIWDKLHFSKSFQLESRLRDDFLNFLNRSFSMLTYIFPNLPNYLHKYHNLAADS